MKDNSIPSIVLSYGCPRSGTTYMGKALREVLHGCVVQKLKEHCVMHPCQSDDGLLEVSRLFGETRLIFVRIVRDPLEIVRSFYALRTGAVEASGPITNRSDQEILGFIKPESENSNRQIERLRDDRPWRDYDTHVVQIKYENLSDERGRQEFVDSLCDLLPDSDAQRQRLSQHIDDTWGNPHKAARKGRLSTGVKTELTDAQLQWWNRKLLPITQREGYV